MGMDSMAGRQGVLLGPYEVQRCLVSPDLINNDSVADAKVFVDFDHTLLACNSTELFIASCEPSLVVALIEFVVRRCIPWRLSRLPNCYRVRDYFCCLAIIVLCPNSISRWKRLAPALFERHVSQGMANALRPVALNRLVIITFGMKFIVRAMLRDSAWSSASLIATPTITGLSYFAHGKRVLATSHAGEEAVAAATFVTDSLDDVDLLRAAKSGILIEPQGVLFQAQQQLYMPLRYTALAKYTRSYVADQIVLVELLLLLISVSGDLWQLVSNCIFVPFLFLSVICVYEIGYFENDMTAAKRERHPTIKDAAMQFQLYPITPGAWIWAISTGALGNCLACLSRHAPYSNLLVCLPAWIAGLVGLRFTFYIYNMPNLTVRLYLYPALQLFKFLAVMVLVSATPIGAVGILGQVATMWAVYITYRHGGRATDINRELLRVILLAAGIVLLLTTDVVGSWFQPIALAVWAVLRLAKAPILSLLSAGPAASPQKA